MSDLFESPAFNPSQRKRLRDELAKALERVATDGSPKDWRDVYIPPSHLQALDPQRMQALGATAADVSRQLRQTQLESAGGRAELGGAEQPLRTLATVQTAAALRAGSRLAPPHKTGAISGRW